MAKENVCITSYSHSWPLIIIKFSICQNVTKNYRIQFRSDASNEQFNWKQTEKDLNYVGTVCAEIIFKLIWLLITHWRNALQIQIAVTSMRPSQCGHAKSTHIMAMCSSDHNYYLLHIFYIILTLLLQKYIYLIIYLFFLLLCFVFISFSLRSWHLMLFRCLV